MEHITGYIEGYYGCLLSWEDRASILRQLQRLGLNSYCYAPKEDIRHRLDWRQPYDQDWLSQFNAFCELANQLNIRVMAGIAPGQDYHFSNLPDEKDFSGLLHKSTELLDAGAQDLVLLMDDIDADFNQRNPTAGAEGYEHAHLANKLSEVLERPLLVVPRVYADEIHSESPEYLVNFCEELATNHVVFYCGQRIVERCIDDSSLSLLRRFSDHKIVFWDNLYANDYCPRRLYLGQWKNRQTEHSIMLNPTGLPRTDELLLSLMATDAGHVNVLDIPTATMDEKRAAVFEEHGVPSCFSSIACWFDRPPFEFPETTNLEQMLTVPMASQLDALETLLWRWKSPLSREWYPYLMGLKQDLLLLSNSLDIDRIHKTQTQAIAHFLLRQRSL